jgi:hypothetical protein
LLVGVGLARTALARSFFDQRKWSVTEGTKPTKKSARERESVCEAGRHDRMACSSAVSQSG